MQIKPFPQQYTIHVVVTYAWTVITMYRYMYMHDTHDSHLALWIQQLMPWGCHHMC
jgi:hypothetical protein